MKVDLRCAIPNWLDSELGGWTALHFAVRNEHVSIAQELVAVRWDMFVARMRRS
jgi:hypothetical protein